jgi:hypothetical protein
VNRLKFNMKEGGILTPKQVKAVDKHLSQLPEDSELLRAYRRKYARSLST